MHPLNFNLLAAELAAALQLTSVAKSLSACTV
jgi:hypothetical protein